MRAEWNHFQPNFFSFLFASSADHFIMYTSLLYYLKSSISHRVVAAEVVNCFLVFGYLKKQTNKKQLTGTGKPILIDSKYIFLIKVKFTNM